jgi:hypothetical protein
MASPKSCLLANGKVFASSLLAFKVVGSGTLGAIWPCAKEQPMTKVMAVATAPTWQ